MRNAQRVRELWQKRLLDGYDADPAEVLGAGFKDARRDMVVIRNIAVHGVCPHHLLPFRGIAHWITNEIANALITHGQARGAACLIEAEQLCLLMGENRLGDGLSPSATRASLATTCRRARNSCMPSGTRSSSEVG